VFAHPLHPYAQALGAAVPRQHESESARLRLIGEPMSPIDPDPKCAAFTAAAGAVMIRARLPFRTYAASARARLCAIFTEEFLPRP
jgi:ABC-type dipeptide/oligopeptide/nickel transport system ATPase component